MSEKDFGWKVNISMRIDLLGRLSVSRYGISTELVILAV
jgi:hypothetical protein